MRSIIHVEIKRALTDGRVIGEVIIAGIQDKKLTVIGYALVKLGAVETAYAVFGVDLQNVSSCKGFSDVNLLAPVVLQFESGRGLGKDDTGNKAGTDTPLVGDLDVLGIFADRVGEFLVDDIVAWVTSLRFLPKSSTDWIKGLTDKKASSK